MDPLTHTLTGATLARAGLGRSTPLATATLIIAANIPDIDIVTYRAGTFAPMAMRRGLTHGPLALLLLPVVTVAAVLLYDRVWRRRRRPHATPADAATLAAIAFVGVLTHPLLDLMNTYGVRLLAPFSSRWFYGDALFIIDPWLWLLLATPFVAFAGRRASVGWAALALVASALVLLVPLVPMTAKLIWGAALLGIIATRAVVMRASRADGADALRSRQVARWAATAAALYIALMVAAAQAAQRMAERAAANAGLRAQDVMVAPAPADPFRGEIVAAAADGYHLGRFDWLARPRVSWHDEPVPHGPHDAAVEAARQLDEVRDYLVWSRYPFITEIDDGDGRILWFRDARYAQATRGGLHGPAVRVDGAGGVRVLNTF